MTLEHILHIIKQGESETVEFKESFNTKALVAINAFANTKGGIVVVGISDNKSIKGISINNETIQSWLNEIKQKTSPSVTPDCDEITIDNKVIVAIRVTEVPLKPTSLQGQYYKRRKNSNHLLNIDDIVTLRMESLNQSFDAFPVTANFDNLDSNALALFAKKSRQRGRFESSDNTKSDLTKLGLIIDGKLTRAAELLFGNHFTSIHIGRFKSPSTIIDDTLIKLPLVLAVEEAMKFIKKNIRLEYEFTGELSRHERWQFPDQALRELLLNAIIHKDYRNPTDVIIKIFDEEILFSNPGGLFGNLTIDDLKTDHYQPSHRNKLLAETFYLMGEVEKYGTGFVRIRKWLKDYPELKYDLEDLGDFTRIRLKSVEKGVEKGVEKSVDIIISEIRNNQDITQKELEKHTGLSRRGIEKNIKKLKEKGILKRIGPDNGGHWEISANDE